MMLSRIIRNFNYSVFKALGLKQYLNWIVAVFANLISIIKLKSLNTADNSFIKRNSTIKLNLFKQQYFIDLREIDVIAAENSHSFGLVREIYLTTVI